ncbi:hypothetical protein COJ85_30540 [Bacillus sp. AFS076308]|nr:hypothetical protein COJ85_30540 [Bacillus sp. AFS076308]PGV48930.1 hypothetical protein COD92_24090 [Bacillus sp. AFS037270]
MTVKEKKRPKGEKKKGFIDRQIGKKDKKVNEKNIIDLLFRIRACRVNECILIAQQGRYVASKINALVTSFMLL